MRIILSITKTIFFIYFLAAFPVCAEPGSAAITILNEGYVTPVKGRNFVPGERDNGARLVASTVALIVTENAVIVVDPGMVAEDVDLEAKISEAGFTSDEITHVFISHHHPDHTVKVGLFPNATVVDFWGRYLHDMWEDHGDQFYITENVWVMRTPGHTNQDASLVVEADNGTYVFTHVWWNELLQPDIDPLAEDPEKLIQSRKKVRAIADFIIPGHGRMVKNPAKEK